MNYLPDVSAWLALVHEGHVHHSYVLQWFESLEEAKSVFVCRVSEMGLLRLLTQTAAVGAAVQTQRQAWATYARMREDFRISFAQEPASLSNAFERASSRDAVTPKLWTDDYLAAFADRSGLVLVTCDRTLANRTSGAILLTL